MKCPICNNDLIKSVKYTYCEKMFDKHSEFLIINPKYCFYHSDEYMIQNDSSIGEVVFNVKKNNNRYYDYDFKIKGKIKIINSSVQETYLHYRKLHLFS